jgi:cellulose synthase/poly-beta-1,6-N-acetylglucosamine synthase-like glycosyltransferase
MFIDVVVLFAFCLLAYTWLAYPVLISLSGAAFRRDAASGTADSTPALGVLIAAHNEETHIEDRVRNLLASDYPGDRLAIYIGVDGSHDRTAEIVRSLAAADARIHARIFDEQRGKIGVLRDLVADCREPLLVFTDANTEFEPNALRLLVRHFEDAGIGGVCGRLVLREHDGSDTDEGLYWRWETRFKIMESRLDSCLGANGAIYAIRRELFWNDIPANTIVDDLVIGMKVREQGHRMIYDHDAVAHEEMPASVSDEWGRRVRIGAGDFQALHLCRRSLSPRLGIFAWMFWSHKVLRWLTPHLLILLLLDALTYWIGWQYGTPIARFHLVFGVPILILAMVGFFARGRRLPGFAIPTGCLYFFTMQLALLFGFARYCRGDLTGKWKRTSR